jgi:hypothetical protein
MTIANSTTSFTDTGAGTAVEVRGAFNISLSGDGVGTYKLEKSYDGSAWIDVAKNVDGDVLSFAKLTGGEVSLPWFEPESGVQYRWNCTADTSGTTTARISQ